MKSGSGKTKRTAERNGETNLPSTEAALIGTVLDFPETLPKAIAEHITPRSFDDQGNAAVWRAVTRLHAEGLVIDRVSLAERLKGSPELNGVNAVLLVAQFESISGAQIETLCHDLQAAELARKLGLFADDIKSREFAPGDDPRAILADVEASWRGLFQHNGADLPAIVDATDFIAQPQPAPKELVRGLLHKGSKLVLGGGSKSFKTWMLLDLALSVAHGSPWLGFETDPGPVLYLNFEIQDYAWQRRLLTVACEKQIELQPGRVKLWNLRGKAADFQTLLPRIATQTRNLGFALIVLDPVYKLYGRADENKAGDVAALLNGLEALAVDTGAAVAFGAHFSKGNQSGKDAIDRISGSGVFARDPDSILIFTRHEVEEAFSVESILRNFAPVDPFAVRWQFPLMRRDGELDPSKLKKAGAPIRYTEGDLLGVLGTDSLGSKDWQIRAKDECGISSGKFYEVLKQLQQSKRIIRSKINGKWLKACA